MPPTDVSPPARYRTGRGRSVGFLLALLVEGLFVLLVLTFGSSIVYRESAGTAVDIVRFRATSHEEEVAPEQEAPAEESQQAESQAPEVADQDEPEAEPVRPQPPQPTPSPQVIPLAPAKIASATVAPRRPNPPAAAKAQQFGPPDTVGRQRDSAVVSGSGPNGEKLYAAAWYREPYKDELDGYLSTATGPGWGLIACRTAPDYRVEDCVPVDEYPTGSNINRAILAAAWQFRVRPPRIGGEPKIGEWVRIRIDYGLRSP